MHTGFKGTRIGLHQLTLIGETLSYEVTFIDEDGVTHGIMRHSIPAGADPAIDNAVNTLVTELIRKTAQAHYTQPSAAFDLSPTPTGIDDLRTALGDPNPEADEPSSSQG